MALDSKAKRAAVFGVGRPYIRTTEPDATKALAWRMSAGNAYPAILQLNMPAARAYGVVEPTINYGEVSSPINYVPVPVAR